MELLWNDLSVLRLIHRSTEQVEVAGSIPPPGGCRAAELLDCSAEVEISNCKTETGKLNLVLLLVVSLKNCLVEVLAAYADFKSVDVCFCFVS